MGLDSLNWYDVAQDRSRWHDLCTTISSGGVRRGPSVVTGSFVCGCGRTFSRSGDLTRYRKHCTGQPPPFRQSSTMGVAEFSGVMVISCDTSITVQVKVVPGPVPWI